jgi:hypothetical protein
MKAKVVCIIAVALFLAIYQPATTQGQTQLPKPSGDVWVGIPTPRPEVRIRW